MDGHADLVNCEHFVINLVDVTSERERDYYLLDSFVIVVCVEGELKISGDDFDSISLKKGETALLPAVLNRVNYAAEVGGAKFIESYIPMINED